MVLRRPALVEPRFGYERFPRKDWDPEGRLLQVLPFLSGYEDQSDEDWATRIEDEQKEFIEALKTDYDRRDGEGKEDTLRRLDWGYMDLENALSTLR